MRQSFPWTNQLKCQHGTVIPMDDAANQLRNQHGTVIPMDGAANQLRNQHGTVISINEPTEMPKWRSHFDERRIKQI